MPFKTITIRKSVYEKLKKVKKRSESFSEFFERSFETRRPMLANFFGIWKADKKEIELVKEEIKKMREEFESDFSERVKK